MTEQPATFAEVLEAYRLAKQERDNAYLDRLKRVVKAMEPYWEAEIERLKKEHGIWDS